MAVPRQQIHIDVPVAYRSIFPRIIVVDFTGRVHRNYDGWWIDEEGFGHIIIRRTLTHREIDTIISHEVFHAMWGAILDHTEEELAIANGWLNAAIRDDIEWGEDDA